MHIQISPPVKFYSTLLLIIVFFQSCDNRKPNDTTESYVRRSSLTVDERKVIETNLKNVRKKKDEFSDFTWYKDKSSPVYVNQNGFFLSFGIRDDGYVTDLRLSIQYYAEDWLFIQSYDFNVDDNNFSLYVLGNVERDNGDGFIWEWYDFSIDAERMSLLKTISTAKKVKIRFNGQQYYNTRTLSKSEIKAVSNILNVYERIQNILSNTQQVTDSLIL